jgi:hypothetical protein
MQSGLVKLSEKQELLHKCKKIIYVSLFAKNSCFPSFQRIKYNKDTTNDEV